jgi:hypothetical protein
MKFTIPTAFALTSLLFSCTKGPFYVLPVVPIRQNEHPVSSLAFTQGHTKPAFNLVTTSDDYPSEYGLLFMTSKKGYLYALGLNVPDTGKYILTLWDADTKAVLLRDSVHYALDHGFLYIDFGIQHKEVEVIPNKKYMASVFMPRNLAGTPLRDYSLFQPGIEQWVPFTQKHITVLSSFFTRSDVPAYPDIQVYHQDVLIGLADIGYYATEY